MEMDEMKKRWENMNNRLINTELVNDRIIREMLQKKSSRSLSQLINNEAIGVVILLALIPFIIYCLKNYTLHKIASNFMIVAIPVIILLAIWLIYKTMHLLKIDISKSPSENIRLINSYNIYIKKEILGSVFLVPLLFLSVVISYWIMGVSWTIWCFMVVAFVLCTLFSIFSYKRIYKRNINSIKESLEELRDLDNE